MQAFIMAVELDKLAKISVSEDNCPFSNKFMYFNLSISFILLIESVLIILSPTSTNLYDNSHLDSSLNIFDDIPLPNKMSLKAIAQ